MNMWRTYFETAFILPINWYRNGLKIMLPNLIQIGFCLCCLLIILGLSLVTVGGHTLSSANSNLVDSLRSE